MNLSFFTSLKYALQGLKYVYQRERNFRVQCVVAIFVLGGTVFFQFDTWEYILIILLCTSVLTLEILNSAVEVMLDILKPRLSAQVEVAKDIMAGAVFLVSLCSGIVGLILFAPHILELCSVIWYTVGD